MKTFVVKLNNTEGGYFANNEAFAGSLGNYKSAEIGISSPVDRNSGMFLIRFSNSGGSGNVLLTLSGLQFRISTSFANVKNVSTVDTYSCIGNQDYYVYIDCAFHTVMTISDITRLDTFDASFNTGESPKPYEGVDIESKDLMKFSMVRNLGLRYSVIDPELFNEENFIYFEKLERLFIGSPVDTDAFETIKLPDGVMRSLTEVNWAVKVLPPNFGELDRCQAVFLLNGASWINLRNKSFSTTVKCSAITIMYSDPDDLTTINDFADAYKGPGVAPIITML